MKPGPAGDVPSPLSHLLSSAHSAPHQESRGTRGCKRRVLALGEPAEGGPERSHALGRGGLEADCWTSVHRTVVIRHPHLHGALCSAVFLPWLRLICAVTKQLVHSCSSETRRKSLCLPLLTSPPPSPRTPVPRFDGSLMHR